MPAHPDPVELPEWPPGTVAILSTGAGDPHAIPVSTAVRAGPRAILFALSLRRESLARLREERRALVSAVARRTGEAHRVINARINRDVGVTSVAKATQAQLEEANRRLEREVARRR